MMEKHELRAAASLAAVFCVRMLGLFMVYPVFAVFARHLAGATPYKIGIDGLSQGVLQLPFGTLSFAGAVAVVWVLVGATMGGRALGHDGARVPLAARRSPDR
jgi:hypothetical protein